MTETLLNLCDGKPSRYRLHKLKESGLAFAEIRGGRLEWVALSDWIREHDQLLWWHANRIARRSRGVYDSSEIIGAIVDSLGSIVRWYNPRNKRSFKAFFGFMIAFRVFEGWRDDSNCGLTNTAYRDDCGKLTRRVVGRVAMRGDEVLRVSSEQLSESVRRGVVRVITRHSRFSKEAASMMVSALDWRASRPDATNEEIADALAVNRNTMRLKLGVLRKMFANNPKAAKELRDLLEVR